MAKPILKSFTAKWLWYSLILITTAFTSKAADYYWVNGKGNWSDITHHWATTSGGIVFHTSLPGLNDNVFFDGNSFTNPGDTVFGNIYKMFCNNMSWSGVTNNPVFYVKWDYFNPSDRNILYINGSLTVSDTVKLKIPEIDFTSTQPGHIIKSQGQPYDSIAMKFSGINGEWQLIDSICGNPGPDIYIINGTFKSNSHKIRCHEYNTSREYNPTIVELDSSEINCFYWIDVPDSICTLNTFYTNINCSVMFYGGPGRSYNNLNILDGYLYQSNIITLNARSFYGDGCIINNAFIEAGFGSLNTTVTSIIFSDSLASLSGIGGSFGSVFIPHDASVSGSAPIDTLIFNAPGSVLTILDTITIVNELVLNGSCNKLARIEQSTINSYQQAVIRKLSGSIAIDHVYIKDVAATGGATFTASNSFSEGTTSGWNFTSPVVPRSLYWVGDSGNWSDMNHWALSSGGAAGNCPPNISDSVFFDSNSFTAPNQLVLLDQPTSQCGNLDFTGANSPIFSGQVKHKLDIYGSLKLFPGMTFKYIDVSFKSGTTGNFIESAGNSLDSVTFNFENSGTYTLHDSITMVNGSYINVKEGYFNTGNFNIHCEGVSFGWFTNSSVNLGTSEIYCKDFYAGDSTFLNLQAYSAFITAESTFNSGAQLYSHVLCGYAIGVGSFSVDKLVCQGLNGVNLSIDTLDLTGGEIRCSDCEINQADFHGFIHSYWPSHFRKATFDSSAWFRYYASFDSLLFINPGSMISIDDSLIINDYLFANGDCSEFIIINSTETGTPFYLIKPTGAVNFNNVILKDISFTGGASCLATNSINAGNVTGITITPPSPRTLFWVGDSGNWNDPSHWAISSGGTGGSCTPTQNDDVYFDANSFSTAGDTIFVTHENVYCKNMDWTGVNQPVITGPDKTIHIFGSVILEAGMIFSVSNVNFESISSGNTLTSKGQAFDYVRLNFNGINSDWSLMDSVGGDHGPYINISAGSFNTNNQKIKCTTFYSVGPTYLDTLYLGSSEIRCHNWTNSGPINTGTSTIFCDSTFYASSGNFNNIDCIEFIGMHSSFNNVSCGNMQLFHATLNSANITGRLYSEFSTITGTIFISNNYVHCRESFINKAVINGKCELDNASTFDTLIFTGSVNISTSGKLNINKKLYINSQASDPAFFETFDDTTFLHLSPNDTVCLEYVYLQGIYANSDSAVFYAGNYSVDLGNNNGWNWSGCTPDTSNVWPGDANYDLIADINDLLYIGVAYGYAGPTRGNASTNWVAQPAEDWLQQFAVGCNMKHADCDGNGIVDASDTTAISLNYGLVHPFKLSNPLPVTNFGTDIYFDMPPGPLTPGSVVSIPIMLGTSIHPANNLYGIALTVQYDPAFIQAGTMQIDFTNSWLGNNSNTLHLTKDFYANGKIDMALVKTDHINTSGTGLLGTLTFKVANNASGFLNLSFSNIQAMDKNEIPVAVNPVTGSVYTTIQENPAFENSISVYPNPVSDNVTIYDPENMIQRLELFDRIGQLVYATKVNNNRFELNVSTFVEGIYILSVETAKGVLKKKLIIAK